MVATDKPRVQGTFPQSCLAHCPALYLQATLLTVCVISAATQVVVALQHEDGRVQGTFSPTTSLWDVVSQLVGRPPDEQTESLLVYMNQQVYRWDIASHVTCSSQACRHLLHL